MQNLMKIDAKEADKKLSTFRKYSTEILLACTLFTSWYMFLEQRDMEKTFRSYLIDDRTKISRQMEKNTNILTEIKSILKEDHHIVNPENNENDNEK